MIRANAAAWRVPLASPGAADRPRPDRWSALEYGCHVRDVFRLYDYRLGLMLAEDDPLYPNWDQDETAIDDDYASQRPAVVADDLVAAADAIADSFARVSADQWLRPGRRSDGACFTVETFARYLMHDPVHHLHDVTGGQAADLACCPRPSPRGRVKTVGVEFFCYHRDRPGSVTLRDELREEHWSYMDRYAAEMIARGPTLTDDGDMATGSVHILGLHDPAAARAFAFDEPNYQAGVYRDVLLRRWRNALGVPCGTSPGPGWWQPVPGARSRRRAGRRPRRTAWSGRADRVRAAAVR